MTSITERMPEAEAIEKARNGDVTGYESLYHLHRQRVYSLCLRFTGNAPDAEDLAQEVFLRLLRVQHYESIRNPEAYLFTVASHVLHQHALRQSNVPKSVNIADMFSELQLTSGDDPAARVATNQRIEILLRAMQELPPKIATTLWLSRFAGLSLEEIAQHLGVSRPSAKLYLARALRHVKDADERADREVP